MKSYSECIKLKTFIERFNYLKQGLRNVGDVTFGSRRFLNQILYNSPEWRKIRRDIIVRDNGCDLAHEDYIIPKLIQIHHIEPLTEEDILERNYKIFDPENLICVSFDTHNAIHFGDEKLLRRNELVIRKENDTCPWR